MNPDKQDWKYQHKWISLNSNKLTLDSVWMGFGWNNNLHPKQFYTVYFWLTSAYSPEHGWRNPCWAGVHHVGGHTALMWQTWMSDLWHFYSWWTWCHLTFGRSGGKKQTSHFNLSTGFHLTSSHCFVHANILQISLSTCKNVIIYK